MTRTVNFIIGSILLFVFFGNAQTSPPQFLNVTADTGGAVKLRWQSAANEVYRIEYASVLSEPMIWNTLYENYPSQGNETIWKDAGSEFGVTPIPHPQDTEKRFYRIVVTGNNDSSAPQSSITSPAAGATLSGTVTISVSITSVRDVVSVRLFVDGEEVGNQLYPETDFVINTAQYSNGPHDLFAVVENIIGAETTDEPSNLIVNFAASPPTSVTFDNFITDFRGSARFLEPSEAETIRFRAGFGAYADWTLVISDSSAVPVRTVTGTGYSLNFVWNGTSDLGSQVAAGFYDATLSATPSAQSPPEPAPSPGGPPSPSSSSSATSASSYPRTPSEALAAGSDTYYVMLPPLPPPLSNSVSVIALKLPENYGESTVQLSSGLALSPTLAATGPQTTTLIPRRVVGAMGTFGIAWQGHHPNGGFSSSTRPSNGLGGRVTLNTPGSSPGGYGPLRASLSIARGFFHTMHGAGYRQKYYANDDNLVASHLRGSFYGGASKFNNVNIGLLIGHGVFGTTPDFTISASGPLQSYFPIYQRGDTGYDWVRISESDFGGAEPTGLRWMGILSCNNMVASVYDDMYDKEVLPINDNLHLLLGSSSTVYIVSNFGFVYGRALTGANGVPRQTVRESWFFAGQQSQSHQISSVKKSVFFRVAGWPACFNDDLVNYSAPDSGNPADIVFEDREVFHP
jgi:hypothetical protein